MKGGFLESLRRVQIAKYSIIYAVDPRITHKSYDFHWLMCHRGQTQMTKEKMLRQAHTYLLSKRSSVTWPRSHLEFHPASSVHSQPLSMLQRQNRGWFALRPPDAAMSSRPLVPWVSLDVPCGVAWGPMNRRSTSTSCSVLINLRPFDRNSTCRYLPEHLHMGSS